MNRPQFVSTVCFMHADLFLIAVSTWKKNSFSQGAGRHFYPFNVLPFMLGLLSSQSCCLTSWHNRTGSFRLKTFHCPPLIVCVNFQFRTQFMNL